MIRTVVAGSIGVVAGGLGGLVPFPTTAAAGSAADGDLPAGWTETSPGFVVPDDEFFREQWWLFNFGQTIGGKVTGKVDGDIRAPEAWAITRGSPEVVVAVLDFGVDYEHPDLRDRIWTNPGETGGGKESNGQDDDGNGYVDDWRGWDFIAGDNEPMDEDGHGTHVAGMIAAEGGDGAGTTGIAPEVRILPLRVGDTGVDQTITPAAIEYAAAAGARIVVMSYRTDPSGLFDQSGAETAAMVEHKEILFVAGAGNDAIDYGNFDGRGGGLKPCNNPDVPNLVCVAGTDRNDEAWEESTFGAGRVHLGAPAESLVVVSRPRQVLAEDQLDDEAAWEEPTGELGSFWTPSGPAAEMTFEEDDSAADGRVLRITHSPGEGVESVSILARLEKVDLKGQEGCVARGTVAGSMSNIATLEIGAFRDEDQRLNPFGGSTVIAQQQLAEDPDEFVPFSFPLTAGQPVELMVKLSTSLSSENEVDLRLDELTIDCWNERHGDRDYEYWAGTSFATPLVAGVAALVQSAHPGLDALQVKQAVLDSVVPLPSLKGKVSTGGRLDAYGALLEAAEIEGSGSGSETSSSAPDGAEGWGHLVSFGSHDDYELPTKTLGVPAGRGMADPAADEEASQEGENGIPTWAWGATFGAAVVAGTAALLALRARANAKQRAQIDSYLAMKEEEKRAKEALREQQFQTGVMKVRERIAKEEQTKRQQAAASEDHRLEITEEQVKDFSTEFLPGPVQAGVQYVEHFGENMQGATMSWDEKEAWVQNRAQELIRDQQVSDPGIAEQMARDELFHAEGTLKGFTQGVNETAGAASEAAAETASDQAKEWGVKKFLKGLLGR